LAELADAVDSKSTATKSHPSTPSSVTTPPQNHLSPDLSPALTNYPELAYLIRAWPSLTADVRKMILGVVKATNV
jgi:hypothetical protein